MVRSELGLPRVQFGLMSRVECGLLEEYIGHVY